MSGSGSEPVFYRVGGAHLNVGTSEETTLQFPTAGGSNQIWLLHSFHYKRSGGTAANYAPTVGNISGYAAGSINEMLAYASQGVGTAVNEIFSAPIPCRTDANGRLYFKPGFDAGADNDGDYEFFFQRVKGS